MKQEFNIYPANYLTGPSMAISIAMAMGKTDIGLIDEPSIYKVFQRSIRGGFCGLSSRLLETNNIEIPSYDPTKPDRHAVVVDANGLYMEQLFKELPIGEFKELTESEIRVFDIRGTDSSDEATHGYFIVCDYETPDSLRIWTDDFPLTLIQTCKIIPSEYTAKLGKGQHEKFIVGHFDICEYAFHLRMLQMYLDLGRVLKKVHKIIRFKQEKLFSPYIEKCVKLRVIQGNHGPHHQF